MVLWAIITLKFKYLLSANNVKFLTYNTVYLCQYQYNEILQMIQAKEHLVPWMNYAFLFPPQGGRKKREMTDERLNVQTTLTRTYCERSRPLPYYNPNK